MLFYLDLRYFFCSHRKKYHNYLLYYIIIYIVITTNLINFTYSFYSIANSARLNQCYEDHSKHLEPLKGASNKINDSNWSQRLGDER